MSNPILSNVMETAKAILSKCGDLPPCFMLWRNGEMVAPPIMIRFNDDIPMEESKTRSVFVAGVAAKKFKADFLVIIWDAAFRTIQNPAASYDATEAPLSYPKSMRTECIIVEGIHLPSGKEEIAMAPYKGGDGEPVEYLSDVLPEDFKMESRFAVIAVDGWNASDNISMDI